MTENYVEKRINEALASCQGNALKAQQKIIDLTDEDPKFLRLLVRKHLPGIVAYNVERFSASRADETRDETDGMPPQPRNAREKFGLDILKAAVSARAEIFGLETPQPPGKREKASQEHVAAIRRLAKKQPE